MNGQAFGAFSGGIGDGARLGKGIKDAQDQRKMADQLKQQPLPDPTLQSAPQPNPLQPTERGISPSALQLGDATTTDGSWSALSDVLGQLS